MTKNKFETPKDISKHLTEKQKRESDKITEQQKAKSNLDEVKKAAFLLISLKDKLVDYKKNPTKENKELIVNARIDLEIFDLETEHIPAKQNYYLQYHAHYEECKRAGFKKNAGFKSKNFE